jgi:hypothetical protein
VFLKRDKDSNKWKIEYDEMTYKIYDKNIDLAGYFFPNYGIDYNLERANKLLEEDDEDVIIGAMNQEHKEVSGGEVLVPLVKFELFDIEDEHIDLDSAIRIMEEGLKRMGVWQTWLVNNSNRFKIIRNGIYTSREDRNMLSIILHLNCKFVLHKKDIGLKLKPILDSLSEFGLL